MVVAALLYLPELGGPALLEPDEGRYTEIAREMVVSGDYVTPREDWVRYFEKPPLVYWTSAASIRIFGPTEFAVRPPAAISSIGTVAVTEILGEAVFGAAAGMLRAMALALSPFFFGFARLATLDPALAFFLTAMAAFYLAVETPNLQTRRDLNLLIIASVMLALRTLAKGPVAVVRGGAIALAFLLLERRAREIPRMSWLASIAVYSAIVIPWFAIAAARNPGFLSYFLLHEHGARYLASSEHEWGPYFLIVVAAAGTWRRPGRAWFAAARQLNLQGVISVSLGKSALIIALGAFLAGCVPLHEDLARSALQEGRLNDAADEIQLALAEHPDSPGLKRLAAAIYTNRGAKSYYAHDMASARVDLNRALAYDPDYSAAYDYLGLVAFAAHNWKDAIADGERAASLAGRPPAAYVETARGELGSAPTVGYHAVNGGPVNR